MNKSISNYFMNSLEISEKLSIDYLKKRHIYDDVENIKQGKIKNKRIRSFFKIDRNDVKQLVEVEEGQWEDDDDSIQSEYHDKFVNIIKILEKISKNYISKNILGEIVDVLKDVLKIKFNNTDLKYFSEIEDIMININSKINKIKFEEELINQYREIYSKFEKILDSKTNNKKIEILLILAWVKDNKKGVYFLPAKVDVYGNLFTRGEINSVKNIPWVSYECLSPYCNEENSIGNSIEYSNEEKRESSNWNEYLEYYYKKFDIFLKDERLEKNKIIIFEDNRVIAKKAISDLYMSILKNKNKDLKLYSNFISADNKVIKNEVINNVDAMIKHNGQMGYEFPLAKSQRKALNHFNDLNEGELLAVNGPPGTGKTTFLQSIVATMVVSSALLEKEPPIIVATSTNNQAVTNVIESFGSINSIKDFILDTHWLNNKKSLATYFPAINKNINDTGRFQCTSNNGEGYFNNMTSKENIEKSKKIFIENFNRFFEPFKVEKNQVSDCTDFLLLNLKRIDKIRKIKIYSKAKSFNNERITYADEKYSKQWNDYYINKFFKEENHNRLEEFNEYLDKNYRYIEFWLAIHYYEGRFLSDLEDYYNENDTNVYNYKDQGVLDILKYISPCLVMTFYRLPKVFKLNDNHLFNKIDLLIVDESGQVSVEIGAPTFSLAKKALIVGDEEQIEPVYNIKEELDKNHIKKFNLDYKVLNKKGINSSSSSIMKLAKANCPYTEKFVLTNAGKKVEIIEKGIFLSEHRRCCDDIIKYCNELVYSGRLEAKRGNKRFSNKDIAALADKIIPKMAIINVDSQCSNKRNGSRYNELEAMKIVKWLEVNSEEIRKIYYEDLKSKDSEAKLDEVKISSLIGIITPFAAQANRITSYLNNSKNEDLKNIVVGTVHKFQGGERKIILFSMVYGGDEEFNFINAQNSMMNVAVSRAKDSFIIVGNMKMINKEKNNTSSQIKPTKLIHKYIEEGTIVEIQLDNEKINSIEVKKDKLQKGTKDLEKDKEVKENKYIIYSIKSLINTLNYQTKKGNETKVCIITDGISIIVNTDKFDVNLEKKILYLHYKKNMVAVIEYEKFQIESVDYRISFRRKYVLNNEEIEKYFKI